MSDDLPTDGPTSRGADHDSIDAYLDVLSDTHRRMALAYLATEGKVPIEDLVAHVVEHTTEGRPNDDTTTSIEIEFTHVHVPKLCDVGVAERVDGSMIRYEPTPLVRDVIDVVAGYEPRLAEIED